MLARRIRASLTEWAICALYPLGLLPAAHHRLLIDKLERVARKEITRLMIFMPPGSAKSTYASVLFPAWYMANYSNKNIMAASHTTDLAEDFSGKVQMIIKDNEKTLGYGLLNESVKKWMTSNRCTYKSSGVGSGIAGFRADIAIIDDPVRTRKDADSETYRNTAYNWYRADVRPRLKPGASVIIIQTRWHEDDLSGRLLQDDKNGWEVVNLPAIAMENDPLGRASGELLWADDDYGYAAEVLKIKEESEKGPGLRDWYSLYQQSPRPLEGSIFKTAQIEIIDALPAGTVFCRAWDFASTADTGGRDPDWTVGGLMGRTPTGRYVIADLARLRGGPDEVERALLATASRDGKGVQISLPQDPGQAGKSQTLYFVRKLSGHRVHTSTETGDKATRASPFASQVNVGNVAMLRADWNRALMDELGTFPGGSHDDIVDALSRGFNQLSNVGNALQRAKAMVS